jgi:hypothetical protein
MAPQFQERLICAAIGAGSGAISSVITACVTFLHHLELCSMISFASFAGLVIGAIIGFFIDHRPSAALLTAMVGVVLGLIVEDYGFLLMIRLNW